MYLPERLFVNNLFKCLNCTYDTFLEKINDMISSDIHEELNTLRDSFINVSNEDCPPMLIRSFIDFVEQKKLLNSKKAPEYCMFKCYQKVRSAIQFIANKKTNTSYIKIETYSNAYELRLIDEFESYVEELEARKYGTISLRNLQRLLTANMKCYTGIQRDFMEYIINKVFSHEIINHCKAVYIYNNWKKILLCVDSNAEQIFYIKKELENKLKHLFEIISNENSNTNLVGGKLWEIFTCLIDSYRDGKIKLYSSCFFEDGGPIYSNNDNDHTNRQYDAILSTHILYFARWIPLISEDCCEFEVIGAVSSIIDTIRNDVFNELTDVDKLLFSTKSSMNLFIGNTIDCDEKCLNKMKFLRKLVITSLYKEPYFKSLIQKYYTNE